MTKTTARRTRKSKKSFEELSASVLNDPVKFCQLCWPDLSLYDKQAEILYSLRDDHQTFVHAANEVGKDFIAGIATIWFFASRQPARVVTSSSGETQLKSVLWSEINQRLRTSRVPFPFRINTMEVKRTVDAEGTLDPLSYIIGHVTNVVENFQGHHLPHDKPRTLYIADEASGIGDPFFDAAESWFHRALVIGNPLNNTNFFYKNCKKGNVEGVKGQKGLHRRVIHIGAEHSPNVRIGKELEAMGVEPPYPSIIPGVVSYEAYLRRKANWDPIKIRTRLEGHFYEGIENLIYPPEWLDACEIEFSNNNPDGYSHQTRQPITSLGIDGGMGRDLTCWTGINRNGIGFQIEKRTPDTTVITDDTEQLINQYQINPRNVVFDAGGGGKQIADELRRRGYNVRSVWFGGAPTPQRDVKNIRPEEKEDADENKFVYKNRRAEMYGILRERIDPSFNETTFGIPEELAKLREELALLPLLYDQEGKMYLPPKSRPEGNKNKNLVVIKEILGRSPDRADSLVLAAFAEFGTKPIRKVGGF
jgi:hypothetical protein